MKQVRGFSKYDVYPDGRVYSHQINRGREVGWLVPTDSNTDERKNYLRIRMVGDDGIRKVFSLHRLIALLYIPNTDNKPEINHINGIKKDNRIENLEWSTRSENMEHAYKMGLNVLPSRKGAHHSKETKEKLRQINLGKKRK